MQRATYCLEFPLGLTLPNPIHSAWVLQKGWFNLPEEAQLHGGLHSPFRGNSLARKASRNLLQNMLFGTKRSSLKATGVPWGFLSRMGCTAPIFMMQRGPTPSYLLHSRHTHSGLGFSRLVHESWLWVSWVDPTSILCPARVQLPGVTWGTPWPHPLP